VVNRWYVRCRDCLAVAAVEEDPHYGWLCGCGGELEIMGQVHRDRLVRPSYEVPCDGRCTGAVGPSCDCQCGGANHGSGRVVLVIRDAGAVPRLRAGDPAVAEEWRAAKAELARAMKRAKDERRWQRLDEARRIWARASKLRTHARRMAAVREAVEWLG
jgi:hypothetical protein